MPVDTPVYLYIYDLSQGLAQTFSQSFLGTQVEAIWHTSVVVFGVETYFGHGLSQCVPGTSPFGRPKETMLMGMTQITQEEFESHLYELSVNAFRFDKYHLLDQNCNHFSSEVIKLLTGASIPEHIMLQPSFLLGTPLGLMMRPLIERLYGPSRLPSSRLETAHALAAYLSLSFPYACLPEVQVSDMLFAYWQSALYEAKQGDASVLAWLPFGELSALLDRYKSRGPLGQLTEALARSIDRIVNESLPTSIHACVLRLNVLSIQSPCFDTLHPDRWCQLMSFCLEQTSRCLSNEASPVLLHALLFVLFQTLSMDGWTAHPALLEPYASQCAQLALDLIFFVPESPKSAHLVYGCLHRLLSLLETCRLSIHAVAREIVFGLVSLSESIQMTESRDAVLHALCAVQHALRLFSHQETEGSHEFMKDVQQQMTGLVQAIKSRDISLPVSLESALTRACRSQDPELSSSGTVHRP